MRKGTKNLQNFIEYIEAYEGLKLTECNCADSGYRVFGNGEVMFHNSEIDNLRELHDDAWMAALEAQEL